MYCNSKNHDRQQRYNISKSTAVLLMLCIWLHFFVAVHCLANDTVTRVIPSYCVISSPDHKDAASKHLDSVLQGTNRYNNSNTEGINNNILLPFNSVFDIGGEGKQLLGVDYYEASESLPVTSPKNLSILFIHSSMFLTEAALLNIFQAAIRCLGATGFNNASAAVFSAAAPRTVLVITYGTPHPFDSSIRAIMQQAWNSMIEKVTALGNSYPAAYGGIISLKVLHTPSLELEAGSKLPENLRVFLRNSPLAVTASDLVPSLSASRSIWRRWSFPSLDARVQSEQIAGPNGMTECRDVLLNVIAEVRNETTNSLQPLQAVGAGPYFASFVNSQMKGSLSKLRSRVSTMNQNVGYVKGGPDSRIIKLLEQQLQSTVFEMMLPIFRRHVQLLRADIAAGFSKAVSADVLPLTWHSLDDFKDYWKQAVEVFRDSIRRLLPDNAPVHSTWNTDFDVLQLKSSLNDFVEAKNVEFQLTGITPRHRRPTRLSFHTLLAHPFGRDHRQDPIRYRGRDIPIYVRSFSAVSNPHLMYAADAHQLLKTDSDECANQAYKGILRNFLKSNIVQATKKEVEIIFNINKLSRDDVFAREMMMLPLAIKNPMAPLVASGNSRKIPPKTDEGGAKTGPER
jgi:hypothetical protein